MFRWWNRVTVSMTVDEPDHRISDEDWKTIVQNVPIVSVDLAVRVGDGLVLGKRTNEPLKGEWFVPGGTVFKNERLREAVHRVAIEELGTDVTIRKKLGSYEHFYENADVEGTDTKHYLATCFIVTPNNEEFESDDQHSKLRVFTQPFPELHPYIERYLSKMDLLEREPVLEEDYR